MRTFFLLLALGLALTGRAQQLFMEADLVAVVKKFHPVARQAALDVRIAGANLTASRGAFDPQASYGSGRKDFDGITYYNQQWTELKIPTWYGIDLVAGTETVKGDRINPEETKGTLQYAGVSLPLVQNMVIDKRRAAVQQARILKDQSEVVRRAAVNDLVAEALLAYWDWWAQHRLLQVVQASVQNARARLAMVKTAHRLGDRPAIDTLEAITQVQVLEQQGTEAALLLQQSRLELSLYLWTDAATAYSLPQDAVPQGQQAAQPPLLESYLAAADTHPLLLEYQYTLSGLVIDRRLKFQSLLPEVTAKYNVLGRDFSKAFPAAAFNNNYRFGLGVSVPLRLSEGRGGYRAAKLKLEQTRLDQAAKEVAIDTKVQQYYLEWQQTAVLHRQQQQVVQGYMALQRGEELRFVNGESSLFLVNAREARTLEGQRKELDLAAKISKSEVQLRWAAGLLGN